MIIYSRMLYCRSLCTVLRIQSSTKPSARLLELRALLKSMQVNASTHTWLRWTSQNGVYVRLSLVSTPYYIGMFTVTMAGREASRTRKYNQRCNAKLAHYELAILYWHKLKNFHQYVPIVCHSCPTRQSAQQLEATVIFDRRPLLNYPFIQPLLAKLMTAEFPKFTLPRHSVGLFGTRLWKKVR